MKLESIQMPEAIESECAVLGILLMENSMFYEIKENIIASDFNDLLHKEIFKSITAHAEQDLPFDVVSLGETLSHNINLGKPAGELIAYLAELAKNYTSATNLLHYVNNVKNAARRREIIQASKQVIQQAADANSNIDSLIEKYIHLLTDKMASIQGGAKQRLQAIEIHDFLALDLKPKEMILSPWMATQSLSMIHAPRGVGKTFLSLGISYAVCSGGIFINWLTPKPRGVLLIDGEMPANSLQNRMSRLVVSSDKLPQAPFKLITPDLQSFGMPDLATYEGQCYVNQHITEDIELIIVDNLSTLVRTGRENDAESWLPIQSWALNLRAKGKSVLFIHHSSKSGAQRGSSRKEDVLDTVIGLRRPADYSQEEGACFEVHFEKARNFCGEEAKPILVQLQELGEKQNWIVKSLDQSTAEKVIQLKNDGMSQKEIAETLGVHKSTVSRHLSHPNKGAIL